MRSSLAVLLLALAALACANEGNRPAVEAPQPKHPLEVHNHHCAHDEMAARHDLAGIVARQIENDKANPAPVKRQTSRSPLRIFINAGRVGPNPSIADSAACASAGQIVTVNSAPYTCTSADVVSASTNQVITQAYQFMKNLYETSLLTFRNVPDGYVLPPGAPQNCLDVPVPTGLNGGAYDYYLFITARPSSTATVFASALPCVFAAGDRKPIMGIINFNPASYQSSNVVQTLRKQQQAALHEMVHALGFTSTLFGSWVDSRLTPYPQVYSPAPFTTGLAADPSGASSTQPNFLSTPGVTSFTRTQFGCSSLSGARLENNGGVGTWGSHWEQQDYGSELMCGVLVDPLPFSDLTWNALADMGWWSLSPTRAAADQLLFGKNLGCNFPTGGTAPTFTCSPVFSNIYGCSGSAEQCSPTLESRGFCNANTGLNTHITTPGCTFVDIGLTSCTTLAQNNNINLWEYTGPASRCYKIAGPAALINNTNNAAASCYQTICHSNGTFSVEAPPGIWQYCGTGSQNVQVPAPQDSSQIATISCPPVTQVCAGPIPVPAARPTINPTSPCCTYYFTNLLWVLIVVIVVAVLGGLCILACLILLVCKCCKSS
jgi:hypothetical protein